MRMGMEVEDSGKERRMWRKSKLKSDEKRAVSES